MRELLTRRLGPFPIWLYMVVLIIGGAILIKRRAGKAAAGDANSDARESPNLTDQPSQWMPWITDIFVNVQQPTVPGATSTLPKVPSVPGTPVPAKSPPGVPLPDIHHPPVPDRQTSITYKVKSGDSLAKIGAKYHVTAGKLYDANKAQIEAVARQHKLSSSDGGHWIFPGTSLVVPK